MDIKDRRNPNCIMEWVNFNGRHIIEILLEITGDSIPNLTVDLLRWLMKQ